MDVVVRHVEGSLDVVVELGVGEVRDAHDALVEIHLIELGGVLEDCFVAASRHSVDDGGDGAEDVGEVHAWALEDLDPLVGVEVREDVGADGHLVGLGDRLGVDLQGGAAANSGGAAGGRRGGDARAGDAARGQATDGGG